MTRINRKSLFSKLNTLCFQALESATSLARLQSHATVDWVHWWNQIVQQEDGDLHRLMPRVGRSMVMVKQELQAALGRVPAHAEGLQDLADHLLHGVERAWMVASVMQGRSAIRSVDLWWVLLENPTSRAVLNRISPTLASVDVSELASVMPQVLSQSPEQARVAEGAESSAHNDKQSETPALDKYTTNITALAQAGKLDPVVGRSAEIQQLVDILLRRRQNNPLIAGEAGVGKTALVEGLAQWVVQGEVPQALRGIQVLSLDLGLLQAGASVKGEFEQRLRQVIDEVQASVAPVVMFIDEVHTLVGAGGKEGTGDAANLLKPALARGQLRTIGATTWSEYKRHIEKDPALTRRFQVVKVDEPSLEEAIGMVRALMPSLSKHHGVAVLQESVEAAVRLSKRYMPDRQLPDKAISLLDTACARVSVSQHAKPAQLRAIQFRLDFARAERSLLLQELSQGLPHEARLEALNAEVCDLELELAEVEAQWAVERERLGQWQAVLQRVKQASDAPGDASGQSVAASELQGLREAWKADEQESALVFAEVDTQAVAAVVSEWTGVPLGRMLKDEIQSVLQLAPTLQQRIVGQDEALRALASQIQIARAGLEDPNKPVGVFMLAGTSGVGKTETALALAEVLYGGEHNLITVNLSEYQEAHTVSSLKGAPPGYVGYGEGGVMTEAVRRKPYSVLLLDEVEKAHPDVHELFFQVFDKGWMEDGEGRRIDFRNCLILLTTNVGTDALMHVCQHGEHRPDWEQLKEVLKPHLLQAFPPAFLGRVQVLPYYPLGRDRIAAIVHKQLQRLADRFAQQHNAELTWTAGVTEALLSRCMDSDSGARVVARVLSQQLLPVLGRELLNQWVDGVKPQTVMVDVQDGQFVLQWGAAIVS